MDILSFDGKNALAMKASGMKDADIMRIQVALRGQGKTLWCFNEYCYYYGGNPYSGMKPREETVLAEKKETPEPKPAPAPVKTPKPGDKYRLKQWHIDLAKDLEIPLKKMADVPYALYDEMDMVLARVLSLKYEYRRGAREIARELDVSIATANNRIHRATSDLYNLVVHGVIPEPVRKRGRRSKT